ncbi:MAG TPA: DUF3465 domain-containing protein [Pyrinomonadaceae bacterium]|jgi:hypothetical protein|nr:DUF3465 domain-containing protein [Pyrinomonadaceae bacterium]
MTLALNMLALILLGLAPAGQSPRLCLRYESEGTVLSGTIKRLTVPGRPNYESTRRGDRPEVIWVLTPSAPFCVDADASNEAEKNVRDVQLVLPGGPADFRRYRAMSGRKVQLKGSLFHSHTIHHRTAVLMDVSEIKQEAPAPRGDTPIGRAFKTGQSDIRVEDEGVVTRILADDNSGRRHQRFILRLASGQTVLIAHNVDVAPRVAGLREGDSVRFSGEYVWNAQGGLVHWTHRDPEGRHEGGWLKHNGRTYQ